MEKYFHGINKKHSFFEGWYLKHQGKEFSIAFIPAFHINSQGKKEASIQVITNHFSDVITFPFQHFHANSSNFSVCIGKNHFSSRGIRVNIKTKSHHIRGHLSYGPFNEPASPLMGPFRFLPFMQCNHGILSLFHSVNGWIQINEQLIRFENDYGYIEKDWGYSFPKSYQWSHCMGKLPLTQESFSIMASVAHIPFGPFSFTGCIASVYLDHKEYRLATYRGVKVCRQTPGCIILKQGKYKLSITIKEAAGNSLKAPVSGHMSRVVKENLSHPVRYQFWIHHKKLFDIRSNHASYEQG